VCILGMPTANLKAAADAADLKARPAL